MSSDYLANRGNRAEALFVAVLQRLGYCPITPPELEVQRDGTGELALFGRMRAALRRLNPRLSDDHLSDAMRAVTHVDAPSLIDANRALSTSLTMGRVFEVSPDDTSDKRSVRYFDFDHPHDNDFAFAKDFCVEDGPRRFRLDLVIFVNGIPLAVIECKVGDFWKAAAIQQLRWYQEAGERFRRFFSTVQVLVAASGSDAVYGTIGTTESLFAAWKDSFPRTKSELERELGRTATAQDVLIYGLLAPANLLDVFRNFTLFQAESATESPHKVLARYHQFRAVNAALARIAGAKTLPERGGIIWHAQGSGKSLTLLWLAVKLGRDARYKNPTILLVTDRLNQEEQIFALFQRYGASEVVSAESSAHLRALLSGPAGRAITTTIQKFGRLADETRKGREPAGEVVTITTSPNVFVLVEEAHRTQYGSLAAQMRAALPNACFIGFTATPLSRQDRNTLHAFGPYIDTYTFQDSIRDGATLPIFFERRLPNLRVIQASEDPIGEELSEETEFAGHEGNGITEMLAAMLPRVEVICTDLMEHYRNVIQPGGFKALVVVLNRRMAVAYGETLDRLHAPESAILISGTTGDPESIAKYVVREQERARTIRRFLDPTDPLSILVVCEMLLADFDAPILQVLYLDSPLKDHALLQIVACVNRAAEGKIYGLVVDYRGVFNKLKEALAIFSPKDVKGAMTPKSDELSRLQGRHTAVLRFFLGVPNKDDLHACVAALASERVRLEFDAAFRRFAQSLEVMWADPRSLPHVEDLRRIAKIREAARSQFGDEALPMPEFGAKVKLLMG